MAAQPYKFAAPFLYKSTDSQGLYGLLKVMEIENAIFTYLESFGKERIFKMAMENIWIFVWKNSKHILEWM